jgi:ABC-2 type transport system ATP-binding protein
MDSIISLKKLTKIFGKVTAVKNLTLDIKTGSIVGFLGPNGAGKSTTINMLLGFISPTSGSATIFGERVSVSNTKPRRDIGFLSNNTALDKGLTVAQEIEYYGHLYGKFNKKYAMELAERFKLDMHAKIGRLSTGNYQKVALTLALMGKPDVLILDEPTNGLDPLVQAEFNKVVLELKSRGTTVFISSHILSEVNELCDEFVFIKKGRIVAKLSHEDIRQQSSEVITVRPGKNRAKMTRWLDENGIDYEVAPSNLEDVFMKFYQEEGPKDA